MIDIKEEIARLICQLNVIRLKNEASYYGYDKCYLNFIDDLLDLQADLLEVVYKIIENDGKTKDKDKYD